MREIERINRRRLEERGTIYKRAKYKVALLKPSTYFVGMSSLGFQEVYKRFNACEDFCALRVFYPDEINAKQLFCYETGEFASHADIIAVSIAYELEIPYLIDCFRLLGLSPLAAKRGENAPLVLIGGPLTFSNIRPLQEIADCFVLGESEGIIEEIASLYAANPSKEGFLSAARDSMRQLWIPRFSSDEGDINQCKDTSLPAYSQILCPDTEFSNMFLIEASRGCHRRCRFCVMRKGEGAGMRLVEADRVLSLIPEGVERVGLVGAAVSDHPQLIEMLRALRERKLQCSLSSLRTDRISENLLDILQEMGLRTLTIAADGPSQRLRRDLFKDVNQAQLVRAAQIAHERAMRVKVYVMIGLPGETDEDIDEFVDFIRDNFTGLRPSLGISPFISKRHTPLDGLAFAGIKTIESRIKRLSQGLRGCAKLGDVSAKWAYIEYCLSQGGAEMGRVAIEAHSLGGNFQAWKKALKLYNQNF